MPFIAPKRRDEIAENGWKACKDVGDPCFVIYKHFVSAWKLEPRWKTAHRLYRDFIMQPWSDSFYALICTETRTTFEYDDIKAAANLAWQVFFQRFVMPYELEKIDQNGDIQ